MVEGTFESVERAYDEGRCVSAFRAAGTAGLLEVDRGTPPEHALLAARLFRVCGAPRRGRRLILETWRRHRRHPRAAILALSEVGDDGPLAVLDAMARIGGLVGLADGTAEERAGWFCARAMALASLRDFLAADAAWQTARDHHAGAWTQCVRAMIDLARDRPGDALAALEEARARQPWYRPAIQLSVDALIRLRRAADARALLVEASRGAEWHSVDLQLAVRHRDAGDLAAASEALLRAAARAPAMEMELHDYIAHALARIYLLRDEPERARQVLSLVDEERAQRISATGLRRLLPVPHVPQDHSTCAPATLTAIAEHWGQAVSHAELAEEICHDGTPAGSERRWAEDRGFVVRQLTVTWDAVRALIDAGIPIALTTSFTLGAHLQPVAGYDERVRTVLVAEPGASSIVELEWDALADDQAPFGPRGMVFLPPGEAHRLDGIELPDAALYDHHFAIEAALQRHDRAAAQIAYDALLAASPADHYLRHHGLRALAAYDGDERAHLTWIEGLRASHPRHAYLRLVELTSRRGHESNERRASLVARLLEDHRRDAAILIACARFLSGIGETAAAMAALRRAIRCGAPRADAFGCAADLTWVEGDRVRATALYRYASCLAEADEGAAWSYFIAALITGEVDAAIVHLRDRVERMHARSAGPAQTLCEAYTAIGQTEDGLAVLERALAAHPDDGELLLVAAEQHRLVADLAGAAARVDAARPLVPERAWRSAAAVLAAQRGELDAAIALQRASTEENPLDMSSQHAFVALLERTGSAEAARAHVLAATAAFPFHIPLAQLAYTVLERHDPAAARRHLEELVERQPRCAWAYLRLTDWHAAAGDLVTARVWLDRARGCADDLATCDAAEASLCTREGHRDRAIAYLRSAIARDIDEPGAVHDLLGLAGDAVEVTPLLDLVNGELARQGSNGVGLLAYAAGLRSWVDGPTTLMRLRELRRGRPHQWHTWAAEVDALVDVGRLDDAAVVAREATTRFGHEPRAWRKLAVVEAARRQHGAAVAAMTRAVELQPHSADLMRALSDAHLDAGQLAHARAVIERALAEDPLDGCNHGFLAQILDRAGDRPGALVSLRHATELEPDYEWAWQRLRHLEDDDAAVFEHARAVIARAPTAVVPRSLLATADAGLPLDARVALLDAAIRLAPGRADLHDHKAMLLATYERWEDALAACAPPFWAGAPPLTLQGRRAWIRFQRGERAAAIDDMIEVVRRSPSYEWGIHRVVDWSREVHDTVAVAERLVAAAPRSAVAHASLGEARRIAHDLSGAEASLRRALELDATDQLARLALFDVLYARRAYAAAAPLLDLLDPDNHYVIARRVQLAAVAGDREEADRLLTRMLVDLQIDNLEPVREAIAGYGRAGLGRAASQLLSALMERPDAPRAVGRAWWDHNSTSRPAWGRIASLPRSPATDYCVERHVGRLPGGSYGFSLDLFTMLNVRRARRWPALLGSLAWALVEDGQYWLARRLMKDHERRTDLEGWMLAHLARALIAGAQFAGAIAVCRRALALPDDGRTTSARLHLAPLIALDDPEAARREVDAARMHDLEDDEPFLAGMSEALVLYARDRADPAGAERLTRTLAALWTRPGTRPSYVARRIYDHIVERVASGRDAKSWRAQLRRLPLGF